MLAIVGFLSVFIIVGLIISKKVSTLIALLGIPILACLIVGDGKNMGDHILEGVGNMAPMAMMLLFAILFFGLMRDAGVFDPLVNFIVRVTKGSPVPICIGTYILTCIGHLDGAGASTVLLAVPAMMPIFDRMNMRRIALVTIVALGMGPMNMMPWGGPTILAATSLGVDVSDLFLPMLPGVVAGIAAGLVCSIFIGRIEKKRLEKEGILTSEENISHLEYDVQEGLTEEKRQLLRPKMMPANVALVVATMVAMMLGILPPVAIFACSLILAFLLNYRNKNLQESLVNMHAEDAILTVCVAISAGVLSGILGGTGMSDAMAQVIVNITPVSLGKYLPVLSGILTFPVSFVMESHTWYAGVLPVLADAASNYGVDQLALARGWLAGIGTVGSLIIPFYGASILLMGLAKVEFGDVQRFAFKFIWAESLVIMVVNLITGALS